MSPQDAARPRPLTRILSAALPWLALGLVLGFAAYYRFDGLMQRGIMIGFTDDWEYLTCGKKWADCQPSWIIPEHNKCYRPAIHLMHGLIIRTLGYNDYSIKLVNVSLDLVTILLLFGLTAYCTRSLWAGVGATLLYAFVPEIIKLAWNEYPNIPSVPFVLLSALLLVMGAADGRRAWTARALLAVSGISLSVAANMHEDICFLGPAYVVAVALHAVARHGWRNAFGPFFVNSAIFTGAFFLPYLAGVAYFGPREVFTVMTAAAMRFPDALEQVYGNKGFFYGLASIFTTIGAGPFGGRMELPCLFLGAMAIAALWPLRRTRFDIAGYLPIILVLGHVLPFAAIFGMGRLWRVFMPLLPLIMMAVVYWYYRLFHWIGRGRAQWLVVLLCVVLAWYNPRIGADRFKKGFAPESLRIVYDELRGKVDENHRLLVLPATNKFAMFDHYGVRGGLAHAIYFGGDALHLPEIKDFPFPYTVQSLLEVRRRYNIRYAFVAKLALDQKPVLEWWPEFRTVEGQPYSYDNEFALIDEFIKRVGVVGSVPTERGLFVLNEIPRPETPEDIVASCDFSVLPADQWAWRFSMDARNQTSDGAVCRFDQNAEAHAAMKEVNLKAEDVGSVVVDCCIKDAQGKTLSLVPGVRLYWARRGDYQPGEWPLKDARSAALYSTDPQHPTVYRCAVKNEFWSGALSDLVLRVSLPKQGQKDAAIPSVTIRSIKLLKQRTQ